MLTLEFFEENWTCALTATKPIVSNHFNLVDTESSPAKLVERIPLIGQNGIHVTFNERFLILTRNEVQTVLFQ